MQTLILNFNRNNKERVIKKALQKNNENTLVIDYIWRKPIKIKGKIIERITVSEFITKERLDKNYKNFSEYTKQITKDLNDKIFTSDLIWQSLCYSFFKDLDIDNVYLVDHLVSHFSPKQLILIENNDLIVKYCSQKNIAVEVLKESTIGKIIRKLVECLKF